MIDQDNPGSESSEPQHDDAFVGRPNWEARELENGDDGEDDDDWMMAPPSGSASNANVNDGPEDHASQTSVSAPANGSEQADRLDPSRFDMHIEDEAQSSDSADANAGDANAVDANNADSADDSAADVSDASASNDDSSAGQEGGTDQGEVIQTDQNTATDDDQPEVRIPRERGTIDEAWEEQAERTVNRWTDLSGRHAGREAFKTGLVLPLLTALGYDTFDPDQVEPLEDDSGQHEGYLAKGPGGELVVLLADTEVADDHRDKVSLRARRDRVTVGTRIPNEEGEGTRWQAVIEVHLEDGVAVASLLHVHREAFDPEEISMMAHQMHGQQEHILEAMRRIIMVPTPGFVEDVRKAIVTEGHSDPAMLSERMALLASRLFDGEEAEEIDQDDDKTRRVTPAEQQALDHIRRICGPEIDGERIVARPAQSYLAVLLDDNNRRTIARLHFSAASRKYIGVFEGKEETRHAIGGPDDVGEYKEELRKRAKELDPDSFSEEPDQGE